MYKGFAARYMFFVHIPYMYHTYTTPHDSLGNLLRNGLVEGHVAVVNGVEA